LDNDESREFIDALRQRRNVFLKDRYAAINWGNEPSAELNKFLWLEKMGVTDQPEFDDVKSKILTK
jgi:hypothetical protein